MALSGCHKALKPKPQRRGGAEFYSVNGAAGAINKY